MQIFTMVHRIRSLLRYARRFGRFVPPHFRLPALILACLVVAALIWWKTDAPWMALGFLGVVLLVAVLFALINRYVLSNRTMEGLKEKNELTDTARSWNKAVEEYKTSVREDPYFYMLIGEPQSGKTTTLEKSGLSFPIGMKAISGSSGTRGCDWWFTDEAIFLDTAGRLTFHDTSAEATDEEEWNWFLDRLRRFRPRCPINGVVVTIPCVSQIGAEGQQYPAPLSIIEESEDARSFKAGLIRQALVDIQRRLQVSFPVYVLVTKADTIGGFVEFCGNLKARGQLQLFGWSRPNADADTPFRGEEIVKAFEEIDDRLRQWRLHFLNNGTEPGSAEDRDRMFAFPDELMKLRAPLQQYLEKIFPPSRLVDPLFLRGFYVSSGEQKGSPVTTIVRDVLGSVDVIDDPRVDDTRAHFVADFYRKKVLREPGMIEPTCGRKRLARRLRAWGYGTAAAAALAGVVMIGLWFWRIQDDATRPEREVKALFAQLSDIDAKSWEDPSGWRVSSPDQRYDSLEKTLTSLDNIHEEITLIDSRQRLGTFGPFRGLSDGLRRRLLANLRRAARVGFVYGVLEPLAQEISGMLGGLDAKAIADPGEFVRYRTALTSLVGMLCADVEQGSRSCDADHVDGGRSEMAARPNDLRALLDFCRDQALRDGGGRRFDRLKELDDNAIAAIARIYGYICAHMSANIGATNAQGWRRTGDYVAWLGDRHEERLASQVNRELESTLTLINQRWSDVFTPDSNTWWRASDESDVDPTYYWWRVFSLYEVLEATRDKLADLETAITESEPRTLGEWDGQARRWITLHDELLEAAGQLEHLAEIRVDLTWRGAEDALYASWHDEFYETLIGLTSQTEIRKSRDLEGPIKRARAELMHDWSETSSRYRALYEQLTSESLLAIDESRGHGVILTDSFASMTRRYAVVRRVIDESLCPWSPPGGTYEWTGILGEDGTPTLERWPAPGTTATILAKQQKRLRSLAALTGLPDGDSDQPRLLVLCRLAVRSIVTRVLDQIAERHADHPRRSVEPTSLDTLQPPDEFAAGQPEKLLIHYLIPVVQWVDQLARDFPPLETTKTPDVVTRAAATLDRHGSDYLNKWSVLWDTIYVQPLDQKVTRCLETSDWQRFVATVTGEFKRGGSDMTVSGQRLSAYAASALAAMQLPAMPDAASVALLPYTGSQWGTLSTRYALASAFYHDHRQREDFIETPVTELFGQLQRLGTLAPDALVARLLAAEDKTPQEQRTRHQLTYFTCALEAGMAAEGGRYSENAAGYVLVAYQLSQIEKKAHELLTDVVTKSMKEQYETVQDEAVSLDFPFSDNEGEAEWETVAAFFGPESAFSRFASLYHSQLEPGDPRTLVKEQENRLDDRFIRVEVPRHICEFVDRCDNLRGFLGLGSDAPPTEVRPKVRRAKSDGSLDSRISYLDLDVPSGERYLPQPGADHWYELVWHMGKDTGLSLSASEDSRGTRMRDVLVFTRRGGAPSDQIEYRDQKFALLRFLHDFGLGVERGNDGKASVNVKVRLPASLKRDREDHLDIEFAFADRPFPEHLPRAQTWH